MNPVRHLVVLFGDQLDHESPAFEGFDPARDAILQIEVRHEAAYIPQHKKRIAFFFAAMRHFRDEQAKAGRRIVYVELDDPANTGHFEGEIARHVTALKPEKLIAVHPGDWRVMRMLKELPFDVEIREDTHFLCSQVEFASFHARHAHPIMETFYRHMRRRSGILMEPDGEPTGGTWNFDAQNREPLPKRDIDIPPVKWFPPDDVTLDVLALVAREFADSPGELDGFDLPVTRHHALAALEDFIERRLADFGRYQDAMRHGEPYLYHAVISGPLNLHLISPREVIDAILERADEFPLNAIEGFIRQILGWREFVRGMYWHSMPEYAGSNALQAEAPVPAFFWTGETDMHCLAEAISHTRKYAYAHHIERLMVLGLFNLLIGAHPYEVHRWHMSMFWDAIDWVSLPNTLGMSQHGDGGMIGTKPYAASGNYIDRMSDHCRHCRYDPHQATGENACPFTTLYWDFLDRHKPRFARNQRMRNQYANLARRDHFEMTAIRSRAAVLKEEYGQMRFLPASE